MHSIADVKCFLFDLDGTVYVGGKLISGVKDVFTAIERSGRRYCFVTNNSSLSTNDYVQKLRSKGLKADEDMVITSGAVAAKHILRNYPGKSVYALATDSYKTELKDSGITLLSDAEFDGGGCADIVLLCYDTELTYAKLWRFCVMLRRGARYIATHPDVNCPSEYGGLPDAGSFMALIETSTGRKCEEVCGKPSHILARETVSRLGLKPWEIAMVGDRINTDMALAVQSGFVSVLVLSGVSDRKALDNSKIVPDYVFEDMTEIERYL